MGFAVFWFIVTAVLWTGFFVLEGFDLGVGMLHAVVSRDEADRRAAINTIGPLWDGNEVWLIVAAAAMFAAFPDWYATMFSGFYLVMVMLLAGLIIRGVSFEFRGKLGHERWRSTWDVLMTAGSILVPFLIGLVLADLVHGVPIGSDHEYIGNLGDLFTGYSVFAGITIVLLCVTHGATFLALKTTDHVRARAHHIGRTVAPITALAVTAFVAWTHASSGKGVLINFWELAAVLAAIAAAVLLYHRNEGWSFTATSVAMASTVISVFVELYPNVMVSSTNHAYNLTVQGSASGDYALKVLTVIAAVLLPVVLLYQAWTYHVFHARVSSAQFQGLDAGGH
ncbi:cytochrome d ubiquinol oxidase subunit II [Actinospica durhamensis]|uniref:Cytochrome d ubiquinol oxidase subunit II n=1 Tax=Actinospica durhamensis TaxID=1508375 RepID=A0A941ILR6_9ACTN|nr:cytochrome d ubiquinol oxidase subunit II [Actinospica durhamensis]MBR7833310.1 cytochrome d ubiquinol oxidase subunit II [Actinospica durhamensis]